MKIYIQGFKSIRDGQFVAIGNRLTFLVGPNSAGKSVVLSALEKLSGEGPDFELDENLIHKSPNKEAGVSACHSLGVEWHEGKTKYGNFATHYADEVNGISDTQILKNIHTCKLNTKHELNDWYGGVLNSRISIHANDRLSVGMDKLAHRQDPFFHMFSKTKVLDNDQIIIDLESTDEKERKNFKIYIAWAIEVLIRAQKILEARTTIENNPHKKDHERISFLAELAVTWRARSDDNLFCWDQFAIETFIKICFHGLEKQQTLNILEKYNSKVESYKLGLVERIKRSYPGKSFEISLVSAERGLPSTSDTDCHLNSRTSSNIFHELMRSKIEEVWNSSIESFSLENTAILFKRVNKALSDNLFTDNGYQVQVSSRALIDKELWDERRDYGEEINAADREFLCQLSLVDSHRRNLTFNDVGSGIGYVLPVLIESFREANIGKIVFLQQPELHLHPALQTNLTDVLIEASENKRIIAETHSEHMILRALKRIRQTSNGTIPDSMLKLKPQDVAVNYFEPRPDGSTKVHILRISKDGDFLDRWPNGFFEERGQELFDE